MAKYKVLALRPFLHPADRFISTPRTRATNPQSEEKLLPQSSHPATTVANFHCLHLFASRSPPESHTTDRTRCSVRARAPKSRGGYSRRRHWSSARATKSPSGWHHSDVGELQYHEWFCHGSGVRAVTLTGLPAICKTAEVFIDKFSFMTVLCQWYRSSASCPPQGPESAVHQTRLGNNLPSQGRVKRGSTCF